MVWDARSGRCELRYEGLKGDVNAVRFFPSGEMLGAACNDGSVSKRISNIIGCMVESLTGGTAGNVPVCEVSLLSVHSSTSSLVSWGPLWK